MHFPLRRFIALALGLLSICFLVDAKEAKSPVIAVLGIGDVEARPLAVLVETQLSQKNRYVLVDRERIAEVTKEWELTALSTASSTSKRVEMGKLLGADLLVLLSESATPTPHCEMVISETSRGIRLRLSTFATSNEPENEAKAIEAEIEYALKKQSEGFVRICAVPPFVSMDLSGTQAHLKTAYARMLEAMLLRIPGTQVVEIAEARQIAAEITLTGTKVERVLPVYFLGEYRFDAANPDKPPYARVIAKQGERVVGTREAKSMTPTTAAAFFRDSVMALLAEASGGVLPAGDPKVEAQTLAILANEHYALGYYEECAQVAEASLLLLPNQPEIHRLAMEAYGRCCWKNKKSTAEALPYYDQALVHMEQFFLQIDYKKYDPTIQASPGAIGFRSDNFSEESDEKTKLAVYGYRKRVRNAYLNILDAKRKSGALNDAILHVVFSHWQNWPGAYGEPLRENLQQRLEVADMILETNIPTAHYFIRELIDTGLSDEVKKSADYAWFTDQLKQRDHPAVKAGFKMMADFDAEQLAERLARKKTKKEDPVTDPTGPAEIEFVPIHLKTANNKSVTFWDMLSCGEGVDMIWGWEESRARTAYLMKTKGVLEPVFNGVITDYLGQTCFDGKIAWIPVIGPSCCVLAIDVASGSVVRFAAEDGLLPFRFAASASLGQGRLCLSAGFGNQKDRRTYIAVLELTAKGEKKVTIIHEATKQPMPNVPGLAAELDPQLSYIPVFMTSEPGENGQSWLALISRGYSCLSINLEKKAASVAYSPKGTPTLQSLSSYQNAVYWGQDGGLQRLRAGSGQVERLRDIPENLYEWERVLIHDGRLHVVGRDWWVADGLDKPLSKLKGKIPGNMNGLRRLHKSSHYGIIFKNPSASDPAYQVKFCDGLFAP